MILISAIIGLVKLFSEDDKENLIVITNISHLSVKGNQIVTDNNTPIILKGAAIEDPSISSREVFFGSNVKDIKDFADWGFNLIRIPIHPEEFKKDKNYLIKYVDPIVKNSEGKGIYILLGWHAHGNPFTGEVELKEDGFPDTQVKTDLNLTKDFWMSASKRYSGNPAVLYSIFNEPAFMNWSEWKNGAEEIIKVIRINDPNKIIFVSGTEWAADLRDVGKNPINLDNIVYEVHPYPSVYWYSKENYSSTWDEHFGYLTDKYPVFIGEFGYQSNSRIENINSSTENYGISLIEYINKKEISWSAWIWSDTWYPPMLKNWDYEPTEFGALVKKSLNQE